MSGAKGAVPLPLGWAVMEWAEGSLLGNDFPRTDICMGVREKGGCSQVEKGWCVPGRKNSVCKPLRGLGTGPVVGVRKAKGLTAGDEVSEEARAKFARPVGLCPEAEGFQERDVIGCAARKVHSGPSREGGCAGAGGDVEVVVVGDAWRQLESFRPERTVSLLQGGRRSVKAL